MLTSLLCLLALPYIALLAIALHGMRRKPEESNIEFVTALKDEARAAHNARLQIMGNEFEKMSLEFQKEMAEVETAESRRLKRAIVAANRQMLHIVGGKR